MEDKQMIEDRLSKLGLVPDQWDPESENGLTARFDNDWVVVEEDESRGLYDGDVGKLSACVVGAPEHNNVRVSITFTPEGNDPDSGEEVVPFDDVEPVP